MQRKWSPNSKFREYGGHLVECGLALSLLALGIVGLSDQFELMYKSAFERVGLRLTMSAATLPVGGGTAGSTNPPADKEKLLRPSS